MNYTSSEYVYLSYFLSIPHNTVGVLRYISTIFLLISEILILQWCNIILFVVKSLKMASGCIFEIMKKLKYLKFMCKHNLISQLIGSYKGSNGCHQKQAGPKKVLPKINYF